MTTETNDLVSLCKNALYIANNTLRELGNEGKIEVHDSHVVDISTKGDMLVAERLIEFFDKNAPPAILYDEEIGRKELHPNPKYTIVFDDIDGTDNYHRSIGVLPFCTLVSIYDSTTPKFKDAIVAGVIEHNSKNIWHSVRGQGTYLNDRLVKTSGKTKLDRRALMIVEHYMSSDVISDFKDIYPASWVKDFGLSALHLAGLSSGMFDGFISKAQKGHELGAGYLLIKEAGGAVCSWSGEDIENWDYIFNDKYQVIAGATQMLTDDIRSRLFKQ